MLGDWEGKFKEEIVDYENLETSELIFMGKEGRNILGLYKELKPKLSLNFYHKVFSFFSVNSSFIIIVWFFFFFEFHKGEDDFWNILSPMENSGEQKKQREVVLIQEIEKIYQVIPSMKFLLFHL